MKIKTALASTFLTTALVFAPVGVATATPSTDSSPPVAAVNHNHHDKHHDGDRHNHGDRNNHWRNDRGHKDYDRWDYNWRSDCFWLGPWLMCMPW
ncbi:hypothetical protein [Rhodococcus chondri]|uniref:Uncharacterized protein n=1 Tax=Rhodococcus chondri TaxID=3065941 RepID=A0ABU7JU92_9NOCA|nr:hypothetical protein [Rhodococcus sp. CC-R104]MEE2033489.1 hypothetical protein [Rhodococcus sp. CC-R104]